MECQFCKKIYSNQYTLKTHQTTTKKCILLQNEVGNKINEKQFKCSYCDKILSSKARLDTHYSTCKSKLKTESKKIIAEKEDELEEVAFTFRNEKEELQYELKLKDEKIKELQERLDKQEKTPKVINKNKNITNNNNNNINIVTIYETMTPERVEEFFKKHYNLDTLMQGMSGLAKFICDGFIREKASYFCTDRSRHKFIMNDPNGNKIDDPNCEKLVSLTAPGLHHVKDVYETELFNRHDDITEDEIHESYDPISRLDKDTTKLSNELSKIVPSVTIPSPVSSETSAKVMTLSEVCQLMRDTQAKLRDRKKDAPAKKSDEQVEKVEQVTQPYLQTIGGFTLGQLHRYKEGYRKRKADSGGLDVEIKGPASLLELCKLNDQVKTQYEAFIMS
jgi:hypothetical protein